MDGIFFFFSVAHDSDIKFQVVGIRVRQQWQFGTMAPWSYESTRIPNLGGTNESSLRHCKSVSLQTPTLHSSCFPLNFILFALTLPSCRLAYLHEAIEPKVVHRDIKSSNILLDDDFNAKISDFGLAKLLGAGKSHITTRVMGTFG